MIRIRLPYTVSALGAALLLTGLAACDDPVQPGSMPDLRVMASASAFADTELGVGTDEVIEVELLNQGDGPLTVSSISLDGPDAGAFTVEGGMDGTLAPGAAWTLSVSFDPMSEGTKSAVLTIASDDPSQARVEVPVTGMAARFQYRQVDRMGIPGLNTVFNHPSGTAGFDKKTYNLASPMNDLTAYRDQFEVVLGAVANASPEGTAALLLPDELPVSLGAGTTMFGMLTGRALSDDAVDVALSVTVGIASLHSDNVDANDVPFRTTFPYVAEPHR